GEAAAVVHAHGDLVAGLGHLLLDGVARHRAADDAGDRRRLLAVALADLVADHATDDAAEHRAAAGRRAGGLHRGDALDGAAVVAAGGVGRRRGHDARAAGMG